MTTNKLNKARVADLHMTMTDHVERGDIPGIVALIGRGDEIYVDAIGVKNVGAKSQCTATRSSVSPQSLSRSLRPQP